MKNTIRILSLFSVLGLSLASAVAVPPLDVLVSSATGKLAYQGKTNASGTFAAGDIAPDAYVVQFNSKNSVNLKGQQFALVVSAGKKKVTASIDGEKFAGGGVAMKIDVGPGTKLTGQVASGQVADNKNVKIIKGKRYVWVQGELGSNIGGRWVEEGTHAAGNISRMNADGVRAMQDRGAAAGAPGN